MALNILIEYINKLEKEVRRATDLDFGETPGKSKGEHLIYVKV